MSTEAYWAENTGDECSIARFMPGQHSRLLWYVWVMGACTFSCYTARRPLCLSLSTEQKEGLGLGFIYMWIIGEREGDCWEIGSGVERRGLSWNVKGNVEKKRVVWKEGDYHGTWRGMLRRKEWYGKKGIIMEREGDCWEVEWYGEKGRSVTRNSTTLEPVWLFRLHISSRLMLARASCWTRMTFSASCQTTATWRLGSTAWWPWCPLTSWPRTSPVLRPYWRGTRWDFLWGYFPFPDPPLTYFMYVFLKFKANCIIFYT